MQPLKCVICVNKWLNGKHIDAEFVEECVRYANEAVLTIDGKSLCAAHYAEHLFGKVNEYADKMMREQYEARK